MTRKLSNVLALVSVLAFSSVALAQDGSTSTTDLISNLIGIIGPLAAIIWWILFTAWGGFRWLY